MEPNSNIIITSDDRSTKYHSYNGNNHNNCHKVLVLISLLKELAQTRPIKISIHTHVSDNVGDNVGDNGNGKSTDDEQLVMAHKQRLYAQLSRFIWNHRIDDKDKESDKDKDVISIQQQEIVDVIDVICQDIDNILVVIDDDKRVKIEWISEKQDGEESRDSEVKRYNELHGLHLMALNVLSFLLSCCWLPEKIRLHYPHRFEIVSSSSMIRSLSDALMNHASLSKLIVSLLDVNKLCKDIARLKRVLLVTYSLPKALYAIMTSSMVSSTSHLRRLMEVLIASYRIASGVLARDNKRSSADANDHGLYWNMNGGDGVMSSHVVKFNAEELECTWSKGGAIIIQSMVLRTLHNAIQYCPVEALNSQEGDWMSIPISVIISSSVVSTSSPSSLATERTEQVLSPSRSHEALTSAATQKELAFQILTRVLTLLDKHGKLCIRIANRLSAGLGSNESDEESECSDSNDDLDRKRCDRSGVDTNDGNYTACLCRMKQDICSYIGSFMAEVDQLTMPRPPVKKAKKRAKPSSASETGGLESVTGSPLTKQESPTILPMQVLLLCKVSFAALLQQCSQHNLEPTIGGIANLLELLVPANKTGILSAVLRNLYSMDQLKFYDAIFYLTRLLGHYKSWRESKLLLKFYRNSLVSILGSESVRYHMRFAGRPSIEPLRMAGEILCFLMRRLSAVAANVDVKQILSVMLVESFSLPSLSATPRANSPAGQQSDKDSSTADKKVEWYVPNVCSNVHEMRKYDIIDWLLGSTMTSSIGDVVNENPWISEAPTYQQVPPTQDDSKRNTTAAGSASVPGSRAPSPILNNNTAVMADLLYRCERLCVGVRASVDLLHVTIDLICLPNTKANGKEHDSGLNSPVKASVVNTDTSIEQEKLALLKDGLFGQLGSRPNHSSTEEQLLIPSDEYLFDCMGRFNDGFQAVGKFYDRVMKFYDALLGASEARTRTRGEAADLQFLLTIINRLKRCVTELVTGWQLAINSLGVFHIHLFTEVRNRKRGRSDPADLSPTTTVVQSQNWQHESPAIPSATPGSGDSTRSKKTRRLMYSPGFSQTCVDLGLAADATDQLNASTYYSQDGLNSSSLLMCTCDGPDEVMYEVAGPSDEVVPAVTNCCQQLFKYFSQIWLKFWNTPLGQISGVERELFLESFWWLLHELSGFNVEVELKSIEELLRSSDKFGAALGLVHTEIVNDQLAPMELEPIGSHDAPVLKVIESNHRDQLSSTYLDNTIYCTVVGWALMMTIIHGQWLQGKNRSSKPQDLALNRNHVELLSRSIRRCMGGVFGSGTLSPLLTWLNGWLCTPERYSEDLWKQNILNGSSVRGDRTVSADLPSALTVHNDAVCYFLERPVLVDQRRCNALVASNLASCLHTWEGILPAVGENDVHSGIAQDDFQFVVSLTQDNFNSMLHALESFLSAPLLLIQTGQQGLHQLLLELNSLTKSPTSVSQPSVLSADATLFCTKWEHMVRYWLRLVEESINRSWSDSGHVKASADLYGFIKPQNLFRSSPSIVNILRCEFGGILCDNPRLPAMTKQELAASLHILSQTARVMSDYEVAVSRTLLLPRALVLKGIPRILGLNLGSLFVNVVLGWCSALRSSLKRLSPLNQGSSAISSNTGSTEDPGCTNSSRIRKGSKSFATAIESILNVMLDGRGVGYYLPRLLKGATTSNSNQASPSPSGLKYASVLINNLESIFRTSLSRQFHKDFAVDKSSPFVSFEDRRHTPSQTTVATATTITTLRGSPDRVLNSVDTSSPLFRNHLPNLSLDFDSGPEEIISGSCFGLIFRCFSNLALECLIMDGMENSSIHTDIELRELLTITGENDFSSPQERREIISASALWVPKVITSCAQLMSICEIRIQQEDIDSASNLRKYKGETHGVRNQELDSYSMTVENAKSLLTELKEWLKSFVSALFQISERRNRLAADQFVFDVGIDVLVSLGRALWEEAKCGPWPPSIPNQARHNESRAEGLSGDKALRENEAESGTQPSNSSSAAKKRLYSDLDQAPLEEIKTEHSHPECTVFNECIDSEKYSKPETSSNVQFVRVLVKDVESKPTRKRRQGVVVPTYTRVDRENMDMQSQSQSQTQQEVVFDPSVTFDVIRESSTCPVAMDCLQEPQVEAKLPPMDIDITAPIVVVNEASVGEIVEGHLGLVCGPKTESSSNSSPNCSKMIEFTSDICSSAVEKPTLDDHHPVPLHPPDDIAQLTLPTEELSGNHILSDYSAISVNTSVMTDESLRTVHLRIANVDPEEILTQPSSIPSRFSEDSSVPKLTLANEFVQLTNEQVANSSQELDLPLLPLATMTTSMQPCNLLRINAVDNALTGATRSISSLLEAWRAANPSRSNEESMSLFTSARVSAVALLDALDRAGSGFNASLQPDDQSLW